jgi:hypothetical protein
VLFHDASGHIDLTSLSGTALRIGEVQRLIDAGDKLAAIKLFRKSFGVGLAEAKEAVEAMARGEGFDLSRMRVGGRQVIVGPEAADAVRKVGFAVGGSIIATIAVVSIFIVGITEAIIAFTFYTIDRATVKPTPAATPVALKATPAPDAIELLKIGGQGNGAGRFRDNRHVAVDGEGRIYSSDYSPMRVQVFDASGSFVGSWLPTAGSNLYGLAATRAGELLMANDKGLFKFRGTTGEVLAENRTVYARSLALTPGGEAVAAAGKSLVFLDADLKTVREVKTAAEDSNAVFGFERLAVAGDGTIYALDRHANEVCKFSSAGKFLNRFPTQADSPNAIAIDPQGRLFLSNTSSIVVLDERGQLLRELKSDQAFGLAFDFAGDLYVASRPFVLKLKLAF